MPGSDRYELSDVSVKYQQGGENSLNNTFDTSSQGKMKGGIHISTAKAFILAFLAIAIAVGIGIIVHFAGSGKTVECNCNWPTGNNPTDTEALEQCTDWAREGNTQICTACPVVTCPTAAPPTTATGVSPEMTTTMLTTTTTTASPVIDVRLPTDLAPILYTVELQPNMYEGEPADFTFNGSVSIEIRCKQQTNKIHLQMKKLNITSGISVKEVNGIDELYSSHSMDLEREFLIIDTKMTLMPNSHYVVSMSFIGPLAADLAGLYLSSYTRGNETVYIATSQMQATDARKTFPCYDEPAIKAQFDVTLVRKSHMKSLSNMPIINHEDRGNGWIADRFNTTPMMSTYLLALIVCDFTYVSNITENGIEYRAWARPEAIDQAPYSLKVGVDILTYFENFFNIPYPLQKQDMIAIPDFGAGAMENWGLITYRETAMLYQPGVSSEGNKQRVAVVVSHELAHQWFGNLVTPSWWDDLWLNEGFASYVEYMGVDHVHDDWLMFDQFVVSDVQDVFNFDGLISSHPLYVPVNHPSEINEIFDRISYAKGASVIRMMRFFLGDSVFQNGLTRYLKELEYGAAFHDDLWFALGNQSVAEGGRFTNVKEIMDTWVLQMNFPTVMIEYTEGGRISVSQSRYLRDYNATDPGKYVSPFDYKWEIPFTYTTSMNPRFNVTYTDVHMMNRNGGKLTISSADIPNPNADGGRNWVIGNCYQYGYYRVNYDHRNWNALTEQLKADHTVIHPVNRAQIINDAWNLAKSGDLDMKIALQTTEYLGNETEYVPWEAATGELEFVSSMLKRDPLYGEYEKFMHSISYGPFQRIGMNNTGAKHLESYVRSVIVGLACSYGVQECIDESKSLFAQWMADENNNPIDPGIKSTVYCTAVAEGGIDEWNFVLHRYKTENVAAEKSRLQSALACSKQTWILSTYLRMAINPDEIRRQDAVSAIVAISRNTIGRSLAWDFFRENWDLFIEKYGSAFFAFAYLINGITSEFVSQFDLEQLKAFIDSRDDLGSGARAFDQALEKTEGNIKWMETNVPIIEQWLKERKM